MYNVRNQVSHVKFNSFTSHGPYNVTWYKLEEDDSELNGICLNHEELIALTNFFVNNPTNFKNNNYFSCDDDSAPGCGLYDLFPISGSTPSNFILRKKPQLQTQGGKIFSCMDIELLDSNAAKNHTYNLEFDVIGEID